MGTRHLIAVMKDGQYPVAQYGQWDGYPSGQGLTVLGFLHDMDRNKFEAGIAKIFKPTDEQISAWWMEVGHDINKSNGSVEYSIAGKFDELHPSLSRDTGGKILEMIQNSDQPLPLRNKINFAADSLFCEWAYVVDLDKNTFEVYSGFNHSPLNEDDRFFGMTSDDVEPGYYGVKLVHSFPLDQLPEEDDFLKICDPQEEEEEE